MIASGAADMSAKFGWTTGLGWGASGSFFGRRAATWFARDAKAKFKSSRLTPLAWVVVLTEGDDPFTGSKVGSASTFGLSWISDGGVGISSDEMLRE
jgi:hypothetical protein